MGAVVEPGRPKASRGAARVTRRAVVGGAVWVAPTVAAAVGAPAAAASGGCTPVRLVADWTSASYTRTGPTTGVYTWVDPLGDGSVPVLTLTIAATPVGSEFSTVRADNLVGTAGPTGGANQPGLELALALLRNTTTSTVTGADYTFTFSRPVSNLSFVLAGIDGVGFNANANGSGAERLSLAPGAATGVVVDSSYLTGAGTPNNPWRRKPNSVPDAVSLPATSSAGDVNVTAASLAAFTLSYRLLDSTSSPGTPYAVYLTPFTFTLPCP